MSCPVVRRPGPGNQPVAPAPRSDDHRSLTTSFSVSLVDDCQLVSEGLALMLEPFAPQVRVVVPDVDPPAGDRFTEEAGSAVVPDILLVDCYRWSPGDDVLVGHPAPPTPAGVRVVAYSWWFRDDLVEAALAHGYTAFLGKVLAGPELAQALARVHAGESLVSPAAGPEAVAHLPVRGVRWHEPEVALTPRETEVVMLVTAGRSNREIADALHLSINSLKSYIRTAYRKMGVTTRSQAVLWGRSHGLYLPERFTVPSTVRAPAKVPTTVPTKVPAKLGERSTSLR